MKNYTMLFLFLLTGVSLFGQNQREIKIFIPPVEGEVREGDGAYFHKQLTYEVVLQYNAVVKNKSASEYIFKGAIEAKSADQSANNELSNEEGAYSPVPKMPIPFIKNSFGRREFFSMERGDAVWFYDSKGDNNFDEVIEQVEQDDGSYTLKLDVISNSTGELIGSQAIVYTALDSSLNMLISDVVSGMLSEIPDASEFSDWRDKWFFFEFIALWAPHIYKDDDMTVGWMNFGFKFGVEFHFVNFLSLGLGSRLLSESVVLDSAPAGDRDLLIEIPIYLKFVFKPAAIFMLEPYGGAAINVSLLKKTEPSRFLWFAGFQIGIKAGPGAIVIDPRFAMDFYDSGLLGTDVKYRRYCMQLGVGYKFGIAAKNKAVKEY
ncbi:MAG: hypothetical protein FWB95_05895 [Treponema sp.]|nr:hypothetical protein [Treponema sp.]